MIERIRSMTTTRNTRLPAALRARGGFTLIELMVVVAIITLLASFAIPSYTQYVVRSHRTAAKQFILSVASKQEQYILDARQYATAIFGPGVTSLNMAPPQETNRYDFALAACAAPCTTYTITATPKAAFLPAQAGDLTLDNLGTKSSNPAGLWDK
jgi:type IV pilus assembly protein PilE